MSLAADAASDPVSIESMPQYAVQLVFTGTPTGTFSLQGSNDGGQFDGQTLTGVSNWTTISTQAVAAAGNHMWNVANAGYRWVRVIYTATSGTGSVTGRFQGKG